MTWSGHHTAFTGPVGHWIRHLPRLSLSMICIRFSDDAAKRKALGFLPGRFTFKSFATGEMIVQEEALTPLALEGVRFTVEGRATYEQLIPGVSTVRDSSSSTV